MSFKSSHIPFWRTRKALSRLPLSLQLSVAFFLGILTVALLFSLATPSRPPTLARHPHPVPKPRPIIVVAAGLPRTGSTWVYNVLRILMRKRDPNTVAGWYADLIAIWKNHKTGKYDNMKQTWLQAYSSLNTSLLLKMHGPGPFKLFSRGGKLGDLADLTVITHRDLRTEVRSWVYQNWNTSVHSGNIAGTPFSDPGQWVRVAEHILKERASTLKSIGDGRYLDIRYEDWVGKGIDTQVQVLRKLADELGWVFTEDDLRETAIEAERLEPPANGALLMYNPVNKLHPGHTRVDSENPEFKLALARGFEAITHDEACNEFLREKMYI